MRYRIKQNLIKGKMQAFVQAYIICDDEVLLLKKKAWDKLFPNEWVGIGGKIEDGETPRDAIVREVREETGIINLKSLKLKGVYTWSEDFIDKDKVSGINYIYVIEVDQQINVMNEDEGVFQWFKFEEIKQLENVAPHLNFHIYKMLNGDINFYSGFGAYVNDELVWYAEA